MEIIKKISFFTCLLSLCLCSCSSEKEWWAENNLIPFHNFANDSITLHFYDKYHFANNATWFGSDFDYYDTLPDGSICEGCGCYYNQDAILLNGDTAVDVASTIFYVKKLYNKKVDLLSGYIYEDTLAINYRLIDINKIRSLFGVYKYYFCGKLPLHNNLENYVFLEQAEMPNRNPVEIGDQSLWLFNVKNNRIISIIRLFQVYDIIDAGNCSSESFRERNIFVYFSDENREKVRKRFFNNTSIEDTKKRLKNINCILYKVNEDGYIEIIK